VAIGTNKAMLLDVVVAELRHRAEVDGRGSLAAIAKGVLTQFGEPVTTPKYVNTQQVRTIQAIIAGGRPLKHDLEHWAESVTIEMMRGAHQRGSRLRFRFLTEDYNARIEAAQIPTCEPWSTPRLLWELVQKGDLTPHSAAAIADDLQRVHRGPNVTAAEFAGKRRSKLGRAGQP